MRGIEDVLYKQNFVTILCNADSDHQKEIEYLAELARRGVDGFIIATSAVSTTAINENLKKQNRPFIVLDQKRLKDLVMRSAQMIFVEDTWLVHTYFI